MEDHRCTARLDVRVPRLVELANEVDSLFLQPLPLIPLTSAEAAEAMAAGVWEQGGEGIVVKRGASLYQRARSKDWLKLKNAQTQDGVITDYVPGDDGLIKTLLVRVEGTRKVIKVAAGIPDDLRREIQCNHLGFMGKHIEFGFNDITETGAYRGIAFVALREDKDCA